MLFINGRSSFMSDFITFLNQNKAEVLNQVIEHIELTLISLFFASVVGIVLGIFISGRKKTAQVFISFVNIIQTIPSLALLGFLIPLMGIGVVPAITALFLYALLPIVRNTFTGIVEVDAAVMEAGTAMGLRKHQLLLKVQIPLALPYIMAGIRTASVINVGVATLSAFIAAGGLGKFILQGIQLNNTNMILAGAIPASLLALLFDAVLGLIQKSQLQTIKRVLIAFVILLIGYFAFKVFDNTNFTPDNKGNRLIGGFPSEFIYREDGLQGLLKTYDFELEYVEMEIGLMYRALKQGEVDVISGFSTDGRIKSYNLQILEDDQKYFPPYEAAPMLRKDILIKYPELRAVFQKLAGKISTEAMTEMNFRVDEEKKQPEEIAYDFLMKQGLIEEKQNNKQNYTGSIKIGSKAFTENYILAHVFQLMIEHHTQLKVEMNIGFGGTKLLMDAMKNDEIDVYPEYTGTALLLMLDGNTSQKSTLLKSPQQVFDYVNKQSQTQFDFVWMPPLGFNNTFAMLMRQEHAEQLQIRNISDLVEYVKKQK